MVVEASRERSKDRVNPNEACVCLNIADRPALDLEFNQLQVVGPRIPRVASWVAICVLSYDHIYCSLYILYVTATS